MTNVQTIIDNKDKKINIEFTFKNFQYLGSNSRGVVLVQER